MTTFKCSRCKETKPVQTEGGTGYGWQGQGSARRKVCFACCADFDRASMARTGEAMLYLTESSPAHYCGEVTNWPGTLRFEVVSRKGGGHNIAGTRTDVWFVDHTGARWHGVQIGRYNTIVRCHRVKG